MSHITVLAGGLGAAKFLTGLVEVVPEEQVHVVANVGGDYQLCGLHVSPDIDLILNALSGELDPAKGWIRARETYQCIDALRKLGVKPASHPGDRNLATCLLRSSLLASGRALDEATAELAERFGLGITLMPATNSRVQTRLETSSARLSWPDYACGNGSVEIRAVHHEGADQAPALPKAVDSIRTASRVILAPADPVRTIGAMLAVTGIREALGDTSAGVVAISPVVGSGPVTGETEPLRGMLAATGCPAVSVGAIMNLYREFLNHAVIHTTDLSALDGLRESGLGVWVENIVMANPDDATRLAGRVANQERAVTGR